MEGEGLQELHAWRQVPEGWPSREETLPMTSTSRREPEFRKSVQIRAV